MYNPFKDVILYLKDKAKYIKYLEDNLTELTTRVTTLYSRKKQIDRILRTAVSKEKSIKYHILLKEIEVFQKKYDKFIHKYSKHCQNLPSVIPEPWALTESKVIDHKRTAIQEPDVSTAGGVIDALLSRNPTILTRKFFTLAKLNKDINKLHAHISWVILSMKLENVMLEKEVEPLQVKHTLNSENVLGGETVESAFSQVHDAATPEISLQESSPPYISEIQIENIYESEITEEGSAAEGVLEPEMRLLYSSHARENKHHGESIIEPIQTECFRFIHENESDLGMIGEMSKYVDLRLEITSTSSSQETLNLNNSFGLDPERDNYLFSAMKKRIKLELDSQRTSVGGQQPSGPPDTSQANGAFLPEYLIVNRSGSRSKQMPTADEWRGAGVVNLMDTDVLLPHEEPDCPNLVLLFLQRNNRLTHIPSSFFDRMPALCFLNLSNTRIRTLPSSLFMLTKLQVLMVRSCVCLDSLPAEVKNLRNMEVLDLLGTDLYYLPKEIGQLTQLRHLQLSFYGPDYGSGYARFPSELVSPSIISELQALQALSIVVHPEDQRWIKIAGDIIQHVGRLKMLSYLQFYFPTVEALKSFIEVSPSWKEQRLRRFKFVVGHNIKRIISRVPDEVESKYDQQDRCLRFVNGNEVPEEVKRVLKPVTAFYLDHHLEIQSLSEFGISNFKEIKFCVVRECPNIQVMIIGKERSESAFPNLEYLGMHYLWELERIWEDPVHPGSFKALKYLRVDTCRKLEYIASHSMLQCLSNLEIFIVEDCESLKSIVKENEMVKYDDALLPRLTELVLRHLPELVTLGSGLCPSEEIITVHYCPKLILSPHLGRVKRRKLLGSSYNCSSICICAQT